MEKLAFGTEDKSLGTYLKEIARVPLLTPEEEKETARLARKGDEAAMQLMIEANLRFVVSVAKGFRNRGLSFLDLINEGNLGLIKSAKTFDPERGVRFVSYAVWWIRQSILAAIMDKADMVRIPQSQTKKMRKITKQVTAMTEKKGEPMSDTEVMKKADINRETLTEVQKFSHGYLSLDTTHIGEGETPLIEFLKDPKGLESFENELMNKELSEQGEGRLEGLGRAGRADPDLALRPGRGGLPDLGRDRPAPGHIQGKGAPDRGARHAQDPRFRGRGTLAGLFQLRRG